jgi:hypothetical protein
MKNTKVLFLVLISAALIQSRQSFAWDDTSDLAGHILVAGKNTPRAGTGVHIGRLPDDGDGSSQNDEINPEDEDGGDVAAVEGPDHDLLVRCFNQLKIGKRKKFDGTSVVKTREGLDFKRGNVDFSVVVNVGGEFSSTEVDDNAVTLFGVQRLHKIYSDVCM